MHFFFNYIYFRVAQFYFKSDGLSAHRAIIAVSMIQCVLLMIIGEIIAHYFLRITDIKPYAKIGGWVCSIVFLLIYVLNHFKYKKSFTTLRAHWIHETPAIRLKKGIAVVLSMLMPWVIAFIVAVALPIPK